MTTVLHSDEPRSGHAGGRPAGRPTEEKMEEPTPCQKRLRKRLQEALLSRFSTHRTRGASRKALRRPHQCSADSTKPSPPKHGFSSCSASRGHPKDTERSPAETRILFVFRIQKAPPGSISQRQFYILGNHEAKVNDSSAFWGIRTQELTTVLRSGEPRGKS